MNKLPEEIVLLKRIKAKLDELMSANGTQVEIRSTDLFDYLKKDLTLALKFPTNRKFNTFLRNQNKIGNMKQFIPNFRVDTSNHLFYQWFFYKDMASGLKEEVDSAEGIISKFMYYKSGKNIPAINGEMLRSIQEKVIYENLLQFKNLTIFYDHPISKNGEIKYTDFYIKNNSKRTEFIWEHFGMTHKEEYKEEMFEKIKWYKENNYKSVDVGGTLIYTYYQNESSFQNDIEKNIKVILK